MSTDDDDPIDPILRIKQVCRLLGRSRSSVLRDVQAGRLPRPLKTGPRTRGWPRSEIMAVRKSFRRTGGDGRQE